MLKTCICTVSFGAEAFVVFLQHNTPISCCEQLCKSGSHQRLFCCNDTFSCHHTMRESNASRGCVIFVGNLPGDVREREVEDLFIKVCRELH